jgi:hypothetical protein
MSSTSITYGVSSVAEKTLMQKEFTSEQRATLGSMNSFFGSVLFSIVSILLGYFADKTNRHKNITLQYTWKRKTN